MENQHDGWTEWSKHVLKELERLGTVSEDVGKKITSLPCGVITNRLDSLEKNLSLIKDNDLRHLNMKINALLFTVLGSVFLTILIVGAKYLMGV